MDMSTLWDCPEYEKLPTPDQPLLKRFKLQKSTASKYVGWETTCTVIVPSDRLRVKNNNPPITKNTFKVFELEVPEDLREYAKVESAHKEFKKQLEL
ncbi:synaptic functional regulator FMR1 [Caerostris extrusa]|uniref:Synaptic functional regulator FMR1 n=1 Tax=Caerostris extrusa TaxID=172846 RepID=A0AAV4WDC5_CAEEX|nr:synaptic functional regulator FMR1 [Caerostris extrusa]